MQLLCDFRLGTKKASNLLITIPPESLRLEPLGIDSKKSTYWYFFGTRLYREDKQVSNAKGSIGKTVWQVICFTQEDWENLANKFGKSKNKDERALYNRLAEDFLKEIPKLFQRKEILHRQR